MNPRLLSLAAPLLGIAALLAWGGEPPGWLLKLEVLLFSGAALAFGYTTFAPSAPGWLFSQAVRGITCIYLGVGAMFVPPQFIVSACFIGIGTRLIMAEFRPGVTVAAKPTTALRRGPGDIVLRQASRDIQGNHHARDES